MARGLTVTVAVLLAATLAVGAAATTAQGARAARIVSIGLAGTSPVDLTADESGGFAAAQARDGRIAFARTGSSGFVELWVMRGDGSGKRALARIGTETSSPPLWSPNGKKIAFRTWSDPDCESGTVSCALARMAVVDVARGVVRVAGRTPGVGSFSWSPDGRRLAYAGEREYGGGARTLETVRADGTERRVLARFRNGDIREVAWSPRGDRIAYVRNGWIWLRRPAGGAAPARIGPGTTIRWAPRGGRLLYRAGGSLRILDPSTRRSRRLARTGEDPQPAWSPDGRLVAYRIARGTTTTLNVVRVSDGRRLHAPVVAGVASSLFFTPDGKRLVYVTAPG